MTGGSPMRWHWSTSDLITRVSCAFIACAGCKLTEHASESGPPDAAVSSKPARANRTWSAPRDSVTTVRTVLPAIPKPSPQVTVPDAGIQPPPSAADGGNARRDAGQPAARDAGAEPPPARLLAYSAPSESATEAMPEEFSVSEVRELHIYSVHTGLVGEHRELRRFYAPSGDLYYEKLVAYSTDRFEPAPFLDEVAVPRSKQIAPFSPDLDGRLIIADVFPLAGTWISDRAMTGTWTVELYLDGATQPNATLPLELVP